MAAPDRIKVLSFSAVFALGGTERHLADLLEGLDPTRFELELACHNRSGDFLPVFEARGIPIHEFAIKSLYGPRTVRQQLRLARMLAAREIAIAHSYNFYANVFAVPAAWLARRPVVVASIRDTGAYSTDRQRLVQQQICRLADHVLVNAEAVRKWLVKDGFDESRISVVYNGVDVRKFDGPPGAPLLHRELGLPEGVPLVLLLARLDPVKRIEDFLEAAAQVVACFEQVHFLVIGVGSKEDHSVRYLQELKNQVKRLRLSDRVTFTGVRHDVPWVLSQVAVSVLPSSSEGLSNTILESMAAGVPVVATAVGGTPELVDDGVNGFLVASRDPVRLAQSILTLLRNPGQARRFGREGRAKVVRKFSLERMVSDTERLYGQLLEARRSRSFLGRRPRVRLDGQVR